MNSTRRQPLWVIPFWITLAVTLARFLLEKMGAPGTLAFIVGITWLPPIFGVYFATKVDRSGALFKNLAFYGISARLAVVALMVLASYLHWGTHYDISGLTSVPSPWGTLSYQSNSARQHLQLIHFPQLIIWPIYTILTGMITGSITLLLRRRKTASAV